MSEGSSFHNFSGGR